MSEEFSEFSITVAKVRVKDGGAIYDVVVETPEDVHTPFDVYFTPDPKHVVEEVEAMLQRLKTWANDEEMYAMRAKHYTESAERYLSNVKAATESSE